MWGAVEIKAAPGTTRQLGFSSCDVWRQYMIRNKNVANASWIIGCKIVQSVLGLVISMLTARYLGPSQFGLINYAASIVAFLNPIANLGLHHILVQEIIYSPESEGKILGSSLVASLFSSVLCMGGVISFSIVTNPHDTECIIVCALYSILLIAHALEHIQSWFQANLISKYTAVISVVAYILTSLYKTVLLITKQNIYWFAVSNAIDHMIIGIFLVAVYKKKSDHKLEFSMAWVKKLLGKSRHFIMSSMMVTIFAQTDKIMLRFMIDDAATGIYSAAAFCAGVTSFVFAAITESMRPTILEHKKNGSPQFETNMCRLYSLMIYMALAQSVAMTLLAKPIILILYGSEYLGAISTLRIVVWHTTFSYIGSVRNVWMLAEDKQKYLWIINWSGAMINIVLNLCFIRLWGVEGAAIASVITQFFTNFVIGIILKPIRPNNSLIIKSLHPKWILEMLGYLFNKKRKS
jgi:O-antigen/teichoic acid export membrane protein